MPECSVTDISPSGARLVLITQARVAARRVDRDAVLRTVFCVETQRGT